MLQDVASAPHASRLPMQAPLASHLPAESQAVMPSSHAPLVLVGIAWHAPFVQVPTAQSVLRLVQLSGVLTHRPPEQTSVVHALLSVQLAELLSLYWQPTPGVQTSVVHALLSLQKTGPLTGVCTQPLPVLQLSSVHGSLSLQLVGTSTTQAPLEQTLTVHALPSSHVAPSA
jgi:hypothetical protein